MEQLDRRDGTVGAMSGLISVEPMAMAKGRTELEAALSLRSGDGGGCVW
jgi:hypothetical protein